MTKEASEMSQAESAYETRSFGRLLGQRWWSTPFNPRPRNSKCLEEAMSAVAVPVLLVHEVLRFLQLCVGHKNMPSSLIEVRERWKGLIIHLVCRSMMVIIVFVS